MLDVSKLRLNEQIYPPNEVRELYSTVQVVCHYDKDNLHASVTVKIWKHILGDFKGQYWGEPSMTFQGQGQGSPYVDTHHYPTPEEALNKCLQGIVALGESPREPILIKNTPFTGGYLRFNDNTQKWEGR